MRAGIVAWINFTSVIPWLDYGVHKNNKNTNNFSIFNWIPRSSRGMTEVKLIHATMPCEQAVGCVAIS
ncbi:hypothetical protein [Rickettsia monacensis]|uniref:hypothetical protein n=1 Tax=Rickettsia monacensis TaxID=109232 RepID=UPI001F57D510|nr:hypothetical protein [Rickettsia monacensis]